MQNIQGDIVNVCLHNKARISKYYKGIIKIGDIVVTKVLYSKNYEG